MSRLPVAVALLLAGMSANAGTIEMKVNGLVCAFCAQGIEKALRKNPATTDVVVSLEDRAVIVSTKEGMDIDDAELKKTISEAGFDLQSITRSDNKKATAK